MARRGEETPALVLKAGREKSLLRRHPWVFSGAVERIAGSAQAGDTVAVRTSAGAFLAWAAYSPQSQIRARVWSFDERQRIDAGFFGERVRTAVARRAGVAGAAGAVRLVHGEADALPGIVCDRYGEVAVFQFASAGAERWRESVVDAVLAECGCPVAYERSDLDVRALEGLAAPVICGELPGTPDRRARPAIPGRRRAGPEDRFLPRPAREPRSGARARRRPRRPQLLLLHRRLHVERTRRRGALGAFDR
jgi:hypothetical protein